MSEICFFFVESRACSVDLWALRNLCLAAPLRFRGAGHLGCAKEGVLNFISGQGPRQISSRQISTLFKNVKTDKIVKD